MTSAREDGFTLIELLIVVGVIGVVAAIAVPGLLKARMNADEASAIGSLRAINSAQAAYSSSAGAGGYADRLATLAMGCGGSPPSFISPDLATDPAIKSGYTIALQAGSGAGTVATDCNGLSSYSAFYATAVPVTLGVTGHRGFATTGASIFYDGTGAAPTEAQMAPGGGAQALR
jgi:type IV pilus assembly protein PilA